MTESIVLNKNPIRADFTADGYLILKIVMWVIELRYLFESQAKVAIQRQFVGWRGPPGPESAREGNRVCNRRLFGVPDDLFPGAQRLRIPKLFLFAKLIDCQNCSDVGLFLNSPCRNRRIYI
jgi:hypothetical protein